MLEKSGDFEGALFVDQTNGFHWKCFARTQNLYELSRGRQRLRIRLPNLKKSFFSLLFRRYLLVGLTICALSVTCT